LSVADNYDDVVAQLRSIGLVFESLEIGRLTRCKVEGDRERRGWYALHDFRLANGKLMIVGSFGVWQGAENNAQKIELRKMEINAEQRMAIKARIAEDRRHAEARRKHEAQRAAMRARAAWGKCAPTWTPAAPGSVPIGSNDYLTRKGVRAHGVRFSARGNLVIPLTDAHGSVHALQVIYHEAAVKKRKGRDKDYWPAGVETRGRFFLIGTPGPVLLIAEGYATAATLHEATSLPVAVAFAAGNLLPVAQALRERYRDARLLICADDDWLGKCRECQKLTPTADDTCMHCGADTTMLANAGVQSAAAAALAVGGAWLVPAFADRGMRKLTDFNDLQHEATLRTVGAQIEDKLRELGWRATEVAAPPPDAGGRGDAEPLKPLLTVDEAVDRYSLVYGGKGTFFDHQEHALIPKSDVLDLLQDHAWREWKTRPNRLVVRLGEIGFDPSETDPNIRCNLWGGWPTTPAPGKCDVLLELLEHLCSGEQNARDLFDWVCKWLAYPIHHPGAKMKTALILHGPQGVGKNLFFEAVMAIYGPYGRIVDQAAIEDKFNDWASRKLFLIGDEVVARQELFHMKNKLKGFVTGTWIRINPKNVAAHDEANHVNVVFLSNERQPLVLEKDDRRYAVIWTPEQLSRDFYNDVSAELAAGGVAALHDYLLNLELGDFKPHTLPPMTTAKADLIALSLDSVERFVAEWTGGETDFPCCPCRSMDLYAAYLRWCRANGVQRPRESNQFLGHIGKLRGWSNMPRQTYESTAYVGSPKARRIVIPDEPTLIKRESARRDDQSVAHWLTDSYLAFINGLESER
jgi:putative DNA primase/helicase